MNRIIAILKISNGCGDGGCVWGQGKSLEDMVNFIFEWMDATNQMRDEILEGTPDALNSYDQLKTAVEHNNLSAACISVFDCDCDDAYTICAYYTDTKDSFISVLDEIDNDLQSGTCFIWLSMEDEQCGDQFTWYKQQAKRLIETYDTEDFDISEISSHMNTFKM